ncbi:MAG: hypothetical protein KC731_12205, partial [Myxococcales bacterium]|nr:hypothetical protein [Myxococcales bacterium]
MITVVHRGGDVVEHLANVDRHIALPIGQRTGRRVLEEGDERAPVLPPQRPHNLQAADALGSPPVRAERLLQPKRVTLTVHARTVALVESPTRRNRESVRR